MNTNRALRNRSLRLATHDYSSPGCYFVTITIRNFRRVFGKTVDAVMIHNELGQIAVECWEHIPLSYPGLVLHTYVVMPNHVHGIIEITDNALCARNASHHHETDECSPENLLLSLAIGSFKSAVTRKMNALRQRKTKDFWYLGYMDRIIRNDIEYNKITQYILDNPRRWHEREERLRRKT